jgi:hypothetical protein
LSRTNRVGVRLIQNNAGLARARKLHALRGAEHVYRFLSNLPPALSRGLGAFPLACTFSCRDRSPGVDAPARWAHSVGAGLKPIWVGPPPNGRLPVCGRLFSTPATPARSRASAIVV